VDEWKDGWMDGWMSGRMVTIRTSPVLYLVVFILRSLHYPVKCNFKKDLYILISRTSSPFSLVFDMKFMKFIRNML
jgi:hypothetical protein